MSAGSLHLARFDAIIVAAGRGERAALGAPKQFAMLGGQPVLRWSVEAFARHPRCVSIIVVIPDQPEALQQAQSALAHLEVRFVTGGATRQQSVANGLEHAQAEMVLVHDAARPGLDSVMIDRLLAAFDESVTVGAVPALDVADTLAKRADAMLGATVDRSTLVHVQTPQAFRTASLRQAHAAATGDHSTDDAQMVRANGGQVALVEGDHRLTKITHAGDLERVSNMLCPRTAEQLRTGLGYDVHRLVPGDGILLGGVLLPCDRRLDGHSDADVLLHAITDALLGAIADGDIGSHFPPSDPRWRGADSAAFLRHACQLTAAQNGVIQHVDATVIAERPKVGPFRDAIRQSIAEIMQLRLSAVSIKATTTERLGFTGREEGIAVQAIATISRR